MKRIGTTILPVLLLVLIACPELLARNIITGQVLNENGQPISQVNIQSGGIERSARTDDEGRFSVSLKSIEPANLIFTHAGYIPRTVRVRPGEKMPAVVLKRQVYPMQGITVTAGRAQEGVNPVAQATIGREHIERDYDIGEVPALLEMTPNLYSFSDAGGGLGYSYLKLRGFDARRSPVYINSVPLNDPEDHALYFVDLPDFASHAENIQVQRGIGNAPYGDAAFGGSINILTSPLAYERQFVTEFGYGGFLQGNETVGIMRKSSVSYSTGLLDGGWSLSGRWADQYSDGYREKSWYDGTVYYLMIGRLDPDLITTLNIYGGPMRTHAAWDGIDLATLETNRRYNPYQYDNETDNFNQPHVELHNICNVTDHLTLNNTIYHIRGKGYYEQLRSGAQLYSYGLSDNQDDYSDLVRRKWVGKWQLGLNSRAIYEGARHQSTVGGSYYHFESEHWGEVIWAEALSPSMRNINTPKRYYEYFGKYNNISAYGSRLQQIGDRLTLSGQLHARYIRKDINQSPIAPYEARDYSVDWLFLSPRIGATYSPTDTWSVMAGFSIASHDPNDDMIDDANDPSTKPRLEVIDDSVIPVVYGEPLVDPERLYDFEIGANYKTTNIATDINLFWMEYRNEIVPDGGLTDDGFPTYGNANRSVHRGIELAWNYRILPDLTFEGNYAANDNLIKDYNQIIDYDADTGDTTIIKHRNVAVPNFPKHLGNFILDYTYGSLRLVYRLRTVGRQFISYDGRYTSSGKDISIDPYTVSSIKGIIRLGSVFGGADITLEGRIDNLFDKQYETCGYRWGDYFYYWPAAERNWFVNLKLAVK